MENERIPTALTTAPYKNGSTREPTYAAAICVPITAPLMSAPKLPGVRCMRFG